MVAVLSGADLADVDPYYGHAIRDRPIVAIDRVRFAGEPSQSWPLAAEDEVTATGCVETDQVEFAEYPRRARSMPPWRRSRGNTHGTRPRKALRTAGTASRNGGNVCYRYHTGFGQTDATFAAADDRDRRRIHVPSVYQYAMETHTVIAQYTPDEISLWATAQHPFLVRGEIAALFGYPPASADCGAVPRRRLWQQVVHQARADGRGHRPQSGRGAWSIVSMRQC